VLAFSAVDEDKIVYFESGDDDDDDVSCLYFYDVFSNSKTRQIWSKCAGCSLWAHGECKEIYT
jgi:hypothetical protein